MIPEVIVRVLDCFLVNILNKSHLVVLENCQKMNLSVVFAQAKNMYCLQSCSFDACDRTRTHPRTHGMIIACDNINA